MVMAEDDRSKRLALVDSVSAQTMKTSKRDINTTLAMQFRLLLFSYSFHAENHRFFLFFLLLLFRLSWKNGSTIRPDNSIDRKAFIRQACVLKRREQFVLKRLSFSVTSSFFTHICTHKFSSSLSLTLELCVFEFVFVPRLYILFAWFS